MEAEVGGSLRIQGQPGLQEFRTVRVLIAGSGGMVLCACNPSNGRLEAGDLKSLTVGRHASFPKSSSLVLIFEMGSH